jgi:hypothetical protein
VELELAPGPIWELELDLVRPLAAVQALLRNGWPFPVLQVGDRKFALLDGCVELLGEVAVGDVEPLLLKRPRRAVDELVECIGEVARSFRFLGQLARGDSR